MFYYAIYYLAASFMQITYPLCITWQIISAALGGLLFLAFILVWLTQEYFAEEEYYIELPDETCLDSHLAQKEENEPANNLDAIRYWDSRIAQKDQN